MNEHLAAPGWAPLGKVSLRRTIIMIMARFARELTSSIGLFGFPAGSINETKRRRKSFSDTLKLKTPRPSRNKCKIFIVGFLPPNLNKALSRYVLNRLSVASLTMICCRPAPIVSLSRSFPWTAASLFKCLGCCGFCWAAAAAPIPLWPPVVSFMLSVLVVFSSFQLLIGFLFNADWFRCVYRSKVRLPRAVRGSRWENQSRVKTVRSFIITIPSTKRSCRLFFGPCY